MFGQMLGENLAAPLPRALGAREFMIERLILRDNIREHLRKIDKDEDEMEKELLNLAEPDFQSETDHPDRSTASIQEASFLLAQFYYELEQYRKAWKWYSKIQDVDLRALYQMVVMCFEGVGPMDCTPEDAHAMLQRIVSSDHDRHNFVIPYAEFHLGKTYFQGYGVAESEEKAEKYWLSAASYETHEPVSEAETALAFFYSRKSSMFHNIAKAYYWHNRAAEHGSLESLGAIGAMNMFGIGVKKDLHQAIDILREASERGNIYSMGLLVYAYYMRKLFTKATDLAKKVSGLSDIEELSRVSCCLPTYIKKGIAIAAFILGRCFERGHGMPKNHHQAIVMYKKCFQYDPDVCQLMQDYLTHEKI